MTGPRSALARHVGPPRPVPPAADRRTAAPPVGPAAEDPRSEPSAQASTPQRRSAAGAVPGAALAVCGVALGISALLWAQPPPPGPVEPAGTSAGDLDAGTGSAPDRSARPSVQPTTVATSSPVPSPAPGPSAAGPSPTAAPFLAPVTVLNNSRITGLAARAAARFEAAGWPVAATGNYRGRLTSTTVFYAPGQEAAARGFAERFPGVERVQPRTLTLPGAGLTVVLTRDFG